jgi:hypothetical protein
VRRPIPTTLLAAALACAGQRPSSTPPALPPSAAGATAAPGSAGARAPRQLAIGGDAASVRRELGDPLKVEKIESAAAPGTRYERWLYRGGREVVFVDGKVADVLP